MTALRTLAAWLAAFVLLAWRLTCRYRVVNDPRPRLRRAGRAYVYALPHAHQLAAVFFSDERAAAMVSRSADGDLLAPSLRLRRVRPVRGSTRKGTRDKGGQAALEEIGRLLGEGVPGLLAVDGPRGPRLHVHRGVASIAQQHGAVILPTIVLPSRRWILPRTWDRFQIPKPFCRIELIFGEPIDTTASDGDVESLRERVRCALVTLEATHDPTEAARVAATAQGA
ncbi:MAG: DUF374 domain-containing protein [Myxococcota bacterium]